MQDISKSKNHKKHLQGGEADPLEKFLTLTFETHKSEKKLDEGFHSPKSIQMSFKQSNKENKNEEVIIIDKSGAQNINLKSKPIRLETFDPNLTK